MNSIVVGLIAANVVFSYKGITEPSFLNTYKFQIAAILRGERIRMLSSGFLHVDYLHLGFNMYALYLFASPVLGTLGNVPFLILYFGILKATIVTAGTRKIKILDEATMPAPIAIGIPTRKVQFAW